jgi:hypothetical protein
MRNVPNNEYVDVGGRAVPVKRVFVSAENDGENTAIAAVAGKRIRVLSFFMWRTNAGSNTLLDGSGGTVLFTFNGTSGGVLQAWPGPTYAFQTTAGNPLIINNPAGSDTLGLFIYCEV